MTAVPGASMPSSSSASWSSSTDRIGPPSASSSARAKMGGGSSVGPAAREPRKERVGASLGKRRWAWPPSQLDDAKRKDAAARESSPARSSPVLAGAAAVVGQPEGSAMPVAAQARLLAHTFNSGGHHRALRRPPRRPWSRKKWRESTSSPSQGVDEEVEPPAGLFEPDECVTGAGLPYTPLRRTQTKRERLDGSDPGPTSAAPRLRGSSSSSSARQVVGVSGPLSGGQTGNATVTSAIQRLIGSTVPPKLAHGIGFSVGCPTKNAAGNAAVAAGRKASLTRSGASSPGPVVPNLSPALHGVNAGRLSGSGVPAHGGQAESCVVVPSPRDARCEAGSESTSTFKTQTGSNVTPTSRTQTGSENALTSEALTGSEIAFTSETLTGSEIDLTFQTLTGNDIALATETRTKSVAPSSSETRAGSNITPTSGARAKNKTTTTSGSRTGRNTTPTSRAQPTRSARATQVEVSARKRRKASTKVVTVDPVAPSVSPTAKASSSSPVTTASSSAPSSTAGGSGASWCRSCLRHGVPRRRHAGCAFRECRGCWSCRPDSPRVRLLRQHGATRLCAVALPRLPGAAPQRKKRRRNRKQRFQDLDDQQHQQQQVGEVVVEDRSGQIASPQHQQQQQQPQPDLKDTAADDVNDDSNELEAVAGSAVRAALDLLASPEKPTTPSPAASPGGPAAASSPRVLGPVRVRRRRSDDHDPSYLAWLCVPRILADDKERSDVGKKRTTSWWLSSPQARRRVFTVSGRSATRRALAPRDSLAALFRKVPSSRRLIGAASTTTATSSLSSAPVRALLPAVDDKNAAIFSFPEDEDDDVEEEEEDATAEDGVDAGAEGRRRRGDALRDALRDAQRRRCRRCFAHGKGLVARRHSARRCPRRACRCDKCEAATASRPGRRGGRRRAASEQELSPIRAERRTPSPAKSASASASSELTSSPKSRSTVRSRKSPAAATPRKATTTRSRSASSSQDGSAAAVPQSPQEEAVATSPIRATSPVSSRPGKANTNTPPTTSSLSSSFSLAAKSSSSSSWLTTSLARKATATVAPLPSSTYSRPRVTSPVASKTSATVASQSGKQRPSATSRTSKPSPAVTSASGEPTVTSPSSKSSATATSPLIKSSSPNTSSSTSKPPSSTPASTVTSPSSKSSSTTTAAASKPSLTVTSTLIKSRSTPPSSTPSPSVASLIKSSHATITPTSDTSCSVISTLIKPRSSPPSSTPSSSVASTSSKSSPATTTATSIASSSVTSPSNKPCTSVMGPSCSTSSSTKPPSTSSTPTSSVASPSSKASSTTAPLSTRPSGNTAVVTSQSSTPSSSATLPPSRPSPSATLSPGSKSTGKSTLTAPSAPSGKAPSSLTSPPSGSTSKTPTSTSSSKTSGAPAAPPSTSKASLPGRFAASSPSCSNNSSVQCIDDDSSDIELSSELLDKTSFSDAGAAAPESAGAATVSPAEPVAGPSGVASSSSAGSPGAARPVDSDDSDDDVAIWSARWPTSSVAPELHWPSDVSSSRSITPEEARSATLPRFDDDQDDQDDSPGMVSFMCSDEDDAMDVVTFECLWPGCGLRFDTDAECRQHEERHALGDDEDDDVEISLTDALPEVVKKERRATDDMPSLSLAVMDGVPPLAVVLGDDDSLPPLLSPSSEAERRGEPEDRKNAVLALTRPLEAPNKETPPVVGAPESQASGSGSASVSPTAGVLLAQSTPPSPATSTRSTPSSQGEAEERAKSLRNQPAVASEKPTPAGTTASSASSSALTTGEAKTKRPRSMRPCPASKKPRPGTPPSSPTRKRAASPVKGAVTQPAPSNAARSTPPSPPTTRRRSAETSPLPSTPEKRRSSPRKSPSIAPLPVTASSASSPASADATATAAPLPPTLLALSRSKRAAPPRPSTPSPPRKKSITTQTSPQKSPAQHTASAPPATLQLVQTPGAGNALVRYTRSASEAATKEALTATPSPSGATVPVLRLVLDKNFALVPQQTMITVGRVAVATAQPGDSPAAGQQQKQSGAPLITVSTQPSAVVTKVPIFITSQPSVVAKVSTFNQPSVIAKVSTVSSQPSVVTKVPTFSGQPSVVAKVSTVNQPSIVTQLSTISSQPSVVAKVSTVNQPSIVTRVSTISSQPSVVAKVPTLILRQQQPPTSIGGQPTVIASQPPTSTGQHTTIASQQPSVVVGTKPQTVFVKHPSSLSANAPLRPCSAVVASQQPVPASDWRPTIVGTHSLAPSKSQQPPSLLLSRQQPVLSQPAACATQPAGVVVQQQPPSSSSSSPFVVQACPATTSVAGKPAGTGKNYKVVTTRVLVDSDQKPVFLVQGSDGETPVAVKNAKYFSRRISTNPQKQQEPELVEIPDPNPEELLRQQQQGPATVSPVILPIPPPSSPSSSSSSFPCDDCWPTVRFATRDALAWHRVTRHSQAAAIAATATTTPKPTPKAKKSTAKPTSKPKATTQASTQAPTKATTKASAQAPTKPTIKPPVKPAAAARWPRCPQCGEAFASRSRCDAHVASAHVASTSAARVLLPRYRCLRCTEHLPTPLMLAAHARVCHDLHLVPIGCPHAGKATSASSLTSSSSSSCEKAFADVDALSTHLRDAHPDEPLKCDACGATTHDLRWMLAHAGQHLAELRLLHCPLCAAWLPSDALLRAHLAKEHAPGSASSACRCPDPGCGWCAEGTSRDLLEQHVRAAHPGARLFECRGCSAAFGQFAALLRHAVATLHLAKVHFRDGGSDGQEKDGEKQQQQGRSSLPGETTQSS